jgi:hypothetical protein
VNSSRFLRRSCERGTHVRAVPSARRRFHEARPALGESSTPDNNAYLDSSVKS